MSDKILMPKTLTAENIEMHFSINDGFYQIVYIDCPECFNNNDSSDCDTCDNDRFIQHKFIIDDDLIKAIYKMAVDKLGVEL